jgi:two-component system cell cycle sensor histidine kinase/response regulator CckA
MTTLVQLNSQIEQLRLVNHYLRTAINQVEEAVVIIGSTPLDLPGPRIYFANQAAVRLTGMTEEEIVGAPIGGLYEPGRVGDLLAKLPLVAAKRRTFQTEKMLQLKGGRLACRWTISSLVDLDGTPLHYVLTFRPVQDLAASRGADAAQSDGGVEAFVERSRLEALAMATAGVAHDFNNVLTTIQANLSLAKLATSAMDRARRPIEDAAFAAESAEALSRQLLTFAKGGVPARKQADLGQLVRRAVRLALIGSNVKCDLAISNDLWGVEVEETQILQVFHNLLTNARQAMPKGGVVRVACENALVDEESGLNLEPGPYLIASVLDRGCGIAEENLSRVFDPFFTTKTTGTGMGLATCLLVAKRHQGTITVSSKLNVGTEFRLFLPASGLRPQAQEAFDGGEVVAGDGTVLVVDDQDGVRHVAVSILQALGYDVVSAMSGEEALQMYAMRMHMGKPIAAVLMDMTLPGGMSGDEAVQEIRRLDPSVRPVATSGYFDDGAMEELMERGYVGVLPKPYTAEKLSSVMAAALSS